MEQRWFAVLTKSASEERVVKGITEQGFNTCLPLFRREISHARRRQVVTRPMFARYVFAQFDPLERNHMGNRWEGIASTRGVVRILGNGENGAVPAPLPHGVIEALQARIDADGGVIVIDAAEEKPKLEPNTPVKFIEGSWLNIVALVVLDEGARVKVLLDMLGTKRVIPVPRESIAVF